jgi:transitional endoplasmic reticulum ATPase
LGYPSEADRRSIFAIHTRGRPLSPDITVEELARLTEGRSGADIEAICRRAALLALRDWIAPRITPGRVQVTEEPAGEKVTSGEPSSAQESAPTTMSLSPLLIRPEHFALAIDEQRERYEVQQEVEDARARKEAGRQRLIEMAADLNANGKPPLRGFRLWLARLFGLV